MPDATPPDERPGSPTDGDPRGAHRVLEPAAALPAVATRLEAHPDLWDGERRVEITDLVLEPDDLLSLQRLAGADPGRMRAALLEAAAERGGLPPDLVGTTLVGRIAARGSTAPEGPEVGGRVVVPSPVTPLPLWLRDVSGWSGGRHLPVAGHAILHAATPLVSVPDDVAAEVAAVVAEAAHVPHAVRDALGGAHARVAVLGGTTVAGAAAAIVAARTGAHVVAAVTGLRSARQFRALDAGEAVLVAPVDTVEAALTVTGTLGGAADLVLVADPDRELLRVAAAVVARGGHVRALVPGADLDGVVREAAGLGSSPRVDRSRTLPTGSEELFRLVEDHAPFAAVVAWRAGTAPAPAGTPITGEHPDGEDP